MDISFYTPVGAEHWTPQNVHVLIATTCEHVTLGGKDLVDVIRLGILVRKIDPRVW